MFEIKDLSNTEAADFFMNDPHLAYMGLADDVLASLYNLKEYQPSENSKLKGLYLNNKIVFVFKYEFYTTITLNIHCYLTSDFQNTEAFTDIQEFLRVWTRKEYPHIIKIICMSPAACTHLPHVVKKFGFVQEGCLKDAVIWRQKVSDLLIFGLDFK